MAITQTADGWTFTHGNATYGPYPTKERAQEVAYDLEHGGEAEQRVAAAYAKLDAEDRPFCDLITSWMDRVDEEFKPLAIAGCMLLEAAAFGTTHAEKVKAGVDAIAEDEGEEFDDANEVVVASFVQGYMQGKEDSLARLEQLLRERQAERQPPA